MIEELLDRSSWGVVLLGDLTGGDLATVLLVLAVVAFGLAIWRALARDVLAAVLLAVLGVVLLLVGL
jgi:hypothetical protein